MTEIKRAVLPKTKCYHAIQPHNKEMVAAWSVVANYKGELREVCTVRWYMGRSNQASVIHCCAWFNGRSGRYASGSGNAGGGGYCKMSAALDEAITSAGIKLFDAENKRANMHGYGDSYMIDGLAAITKALGFRKFTIIRHGH